MLGHERLEPLHRKLAADRFLHVAHKLQHLVQPEGVEPEYHRLHEDRRVIMRGYCGHDEHKIVEYGKEPQRYHGPHRASSNQKDSSGQSAGASSVLSQMRRIHEEPPD